MEKVIGLDVILNRFFGEDEDCSAWDIDAKNLIIDTAQHRFETHDLRNGNAKYTLVSLTDFLLFLQDMHDHIDDNDGYKITQEQIDLLQASRGRRRASDVYINLEV